MSRCVSWQYSAIDSIVIGFAIQNARAFFSRLAHMLTTLLKEIVPITMPSRPAKVAPIVTTELDYSWCYSPNSWTTVGGASYYPSKYNQKQSPQALRYPSSNSHAMIRSNSEGMLKLDHLVASVQRSKRDLSYCLAKLKNWKTTIGEVMPAIKYFIRLLIMIVVSRTTFWKASESFTSVKMTP